MATFTGIGFSQDIDPVKAALAAADQAKFNIHSSHFDFAIVLNTAHYNPQDFLPPLYSYLKKIKLIGTSTAAILLADRIEKRGIAVLLMYSDDIRFETGMVDNLHLQDLKAAGQQMSSSCLLDYGHEHRKLFLFFIDGLLQELSYFISGLTESFRGIIPVAGAGSSDDFQFKKTHQYLNNTVLTSGACGVVFGGRVQAGLSCHHGWRPLGKPRIITEAEGNLVRTIDDKPAAEIYQEYFDTTAETLRASSLTHLNTRYPLGTPLGPKRDYLVRNVLTKLDDDSIIFQDSVVQGQPIHLMIGNKESCLVAAEQAAREVKGHLRGRTPKLIFIIESLSRYRILGRSAGGEIQRVREILGGDVPVFGLYSFGEIVTFFTPSGQETILQNESIIVVAIS